MTTKTHIVKVGIKTYNVDCPHLETKKDVTTLIKLLGVEKVLLLLNYALSLKTRADFCKTCKPR